VVESSSGVARIDSATLGLSGSVGAKWRIAATSRRSPSTPTKMATTISTSGNSTPGVLYDSVARSPARSSPTSTATIPSTVSQVIASHAGRLMVGELQGPRDRRPAGQLVDEGGLATQTRDPRLHAVVLALGGDRARRGQQPWLWPRE